MNKASVIISFYNKFDALLLILYALEIQKTDEKFEVIIADDGSSEEVKNKIANIKKDYHFQLTHIWHPDKGWRKNIILNKAIEVSTSDYLIFIDGDCIPHKRFVYQHLKNKKQQSLLAGRRMNLTRKESTEITINFLRKNHWETVIWFKTLLAPKMEKSKKLIYGIYFPYLGVRHIISRKDKWVLGSNFSLHKTDILAVNGFDERYLAPAAGEDTDLELRP